MKTYGSSPTRCCGWFFMLQVFFSGVCVCVCLGFFVWIFCCGFVFFSQSKAEGKYLIPPLIISHVAFWE